MRSFNRNNRSKFTRIVVHRFNGIRLIPSFCRIIRSACTFVVRKVRYSRYILETKKPFQIPNSHVDADSSHVPLWQAKEVRYIAEPETILEIARSRGAARGPEFPLP